MWETRRRTTRTVTLYINACKIQSTVAAQLYGGYSCSLATGQTRILAMTSTVIFKPVCIVWTVWTVYFIQIPEGHRPKWKHKHINTNICRGNLSHKVARIHAAWLSLTELQIHPKNKSADVMILAKTNKSYWIN